MDTNSTSQELHTRLADAEAIIAALRSGEVDAILMEHTIVLLRLKDVEDELLKTQRKLEQRVLERTAAFVEVNCRLQQEIAARTHAEEALRESAEYLHVVLKHAGLIVAQTDLQSGYTRIHHPPPDSDLAGSAGQCVAELADHEDARRLFQMKQQVMTTGIGARAELDVPVLHDVRHYDLLVEPQHNAAGRVIGAITSANDMTERKQTEEKLRRATAAMAAANRVKSQFIATLSHDLLTSLNALLSDAQGFGQPPNVTETQPQRLDIVHRSAEHLLGMLHDLLDFSTTAAGPNAATGRPFNVRRVLDAIIASLRASAETKGLALTCEYAPDVPEAASGDDLHLQHILRNLLRNAIEFTEHGGVTLRVRRSETNLRFVVEDTGVGIPAEQLEAIFAPFYHVPADASQSKGTGIGLSISRMLARLMHSELYVWSAVGQGSAFWFDLALPAVEADPATTPPHQEQGC